MPTVDPAFGRVGKQVIENTGPLDTKRMETIDEEFLAAAKDFINRQQQAATPWFCYFNTTRMHLFTHLKKELQGKTGLGVFPDGMVETDGHVGQLLKLLDDLGIPRITPSSSIRRTTGQRRTVGRTAARRRSGARRPPIGRLDFARHAASAGRV